MSTSVQSVRSSVLYRWRHNRSENSQNSLSSLKTTSPLLGNQCAISNKLGWLVESVKSTAQGGTHGLYPIEDRLKANKEK